MPNLMLAVRCFTHSVVKILSDLVDLRSVAKFYKLNFVCAKLTPSDSAEGYRRFSSTLGLALLGLDEYSLNICSLLCFSSGRTL